MPSIFTLLMTVFFLQGTIGLSLVSHYCGDWLASQQLGWFSGSAGCGMEDEAKDCEKRPEATQDQHCCHNEVQTLKVDDSLKSTAMASVDFVPFLLFLIVYVSGYFRLATGYRELALPGYSPPHRFTHRRFRAFLQIFRN